MATTIHRADTRGGGDQGWLRSRHTFSFADYHDRERMGFGALRVLNDDLVAPGAGFPTHRHRNMEIVSIPLSGTLHHKDSTGRDEALHPGEVQRMSAGTGITHSEYNASATEPVNFLQIWVRPKTRDIPPDYEQRPFPAVGRQNRIQFIVAPKRRDGALDIQQDAWFALADITAANTLRYAMQRPGNGVYVFLIDGGLAVAGEQMNKRDGLGVCGADELTLTARGNARVLLMEVPML
ncbi:MAG TPA: pirin family protein [Gammaproteobacteria bacterium]|nr:pirin family protein [Gammaproteobacteria bacterium]